MRAVCAGCRITGQVIAFAARFALEPTGAATATVIHLIQGAADTVIDANHSLEAAKIWGTNVAVNIIPGMTHGIDARMVSVAPKKIPALYAPFLDWPV